MKCNFCGHENDDGAIICVECGGIIDSDSSEPETVNAPETDSADSQPVEANILDDVIGVEYVAPEETKSEVSSDIEAIELTTDQPEIVDISSGESAVVAPAEPEKTGAPAAKDSGGNSEKKKILIPIVIALAVVVILAIIVCSSKPKVSIADYVKNDIAFKGVNGYGRVEVNSINDIIDCSQLSSDLTGKNSSGYYGFYGGDYYSIMDYLDYECLSDNNGSLENGDTVEFLITINTEGIEDNKEFEKKIKEHGTYTVSYTVDGLNEGVAINVFDAVYAFVYDDTASYNKSYVALKKDYETTYKNGIRVTSNGQEIRVYGDEFYSFTVGVKTITDNIDVNSTSVKLYLNCEYDKYLEYGIILSPSEQSFEPITISYVKDNTFSVSDRNKLTEKVRNKAAEEFSDSSYTLSQAIMYYDAGTRHSRLAYFYKIDDYYYVIYYKDLKQYNDGSIVKMSETEPDIEGWWGYSRYDSVQDYEDSLTYTNYYTIPIE